MLLVASLAWALPNAVYQGTWPTLAPDGRHVAWMRGESAPRHVCITAVTAPDGCLEGPEASWVRWLDGDTLVFGSPEAWGTLELASGATTTRALAPGSRIHAVLRDVLLVEGPPGTLTPVGADGMPHAPAWTVERGSRPLLDETGHSVGALRWQEGEDPVWVDLLDAEGRAFARRWLWRDGAPGSWRLSSRRAHGGIAYAIDRAEGDHGVLERIDFNSGAITTLHAPAAGLIQEVLLGLDGEPDAVAVTWARTAWTILDPSVEPDFAWLVANVDGDVAVEARSDADARWLVTVTPGSTPTFAAVYDRSARTITRVPPHTDGDAWPWARTDAFEVRTRDGLPITSYLTRPDPERFPGPRPLVVSLHGGPWSARYRWGFDPDAQRLAERGWATLRLNFRGSGGHGRAFSRAGHGEWTRGMRTDVEDAVSTAVDVGVADRQRIALVGGSYGGYATLAAAIFTPELARCGASFAGPPNVHLGLNRGLRPSDLGRIQLGGRAEQVGFPLMLVSGDADRIVSIGPVRRFAKRANAAGRVVTLVSLPGEGHHASPEAWDAIRPALDHFLARCFDEESAPVEPSARLRVEVDGAGVFAPRVTESPMGGVP